MIKLIICIVVGMTIKDWLIDPIIMSFFQPRYKVEKKSFEEKIKEMQELKTKEKSGE